MTLRGHVFVGAGAAVALSGMTLGLHDLTRVGALLLVLPLLASLLTRRPVTMEVTRSLSPARIPTDGHADVRLSVRNTGRATSPLLRGEEELAYALGDRPHLLVPRLRRDEERTLSYRVRSHVRGHHTVGPLVVRVSDPFGLATRSTPVPGTSALVVLPRTVPLLPIRGVPAGSGGESASSPRLALHGEDDVGVREYRIGDDLRRIHWRSTARTGETMVRQDEEPTRRRALVVLDDRASVHAGTGNGGSFEWAVTAAASVMALLLGQRFDVHLVLASDPVGRVVPLDGVEEALDRLAAVTPSRGTSAHRVVEALEDFAQHGGGLVVPVLGGLAPDEVERCAAATSHGLALVIDREAFTGGGGQAVPDGHGAGERTARVLALGGWRTQLVGPGEELPATWESLTVGRTVRA